MYRLCTGEGIREVRAEFWVKVGEEWRNGWNWYHSFSPSFFGVGGVLLYVREQ